MCYPRALRATLLGLCLLLMLVACGDGKPPNGRKSSPSPAGKKAAKKVASGPKDVPIATFGGPTQFIYLGILTDNNKKMIKCEGLPNKAFLDFTMYDSNGGDLFTYAVTMDSSTSTPLSLILIDTSDSGSFNSMIWPKIKPSLVNNVNGYVSISHFDDDHIKNAVASLAKISQKAPDGADPKDPRTLREALDLQDDDKNHILNVGYNSVSRIMLDLGYTYNDVKSTFKPTRDGDYMDDYKANLKANDHWKCDCDDADGCLNVVTQIQSVVTNSNSNGSIAKRDLAEDYDLTMMRKTDGFFTQFPADKCLVNKIQLECDFKTGQGSNLFLPLSNPLAVATTIWPSKKYFLCEAAPVLGGLTGTVRDGSVLTNAASTSMILRPRCNDMNLPSLWGVTTGDIYTTDELPKLQEALKPYVGTSAKFLFLKVPHHGSDRTNDEDFFKNFQATVYLIGGGDRGDGNPDVNVFKWILRNRRPDVNVKWDATSKKCYYDITPNGGDPIYIALSKGQLFDGKGSENFLPSYFGDTIETSEKNCKEKCWTPSCRQYSLLFIDEKEMGGFISLQTEIGTTGEARAYIRGRGIIGINCNVIAHGACQSIGDLPGFLNEIEHYDKEFEKILNAKRQTMSKGQKGNSRFNYYRAQKSKDYGPVIVHWERAIKGDTLPLSEKQKQVLHDRGLRTGNRKYLHGFTKERKIGPAALDDSDEMED